ncbi:unnamed protein product [Agarophyton chilense]
MQNKTVKLLLRTSYMVRRSFVVGTVMDTAIGSSYSDVASVFNSQNHIDEITSGLEESILFYSEKFTFILRHKHFDLRPGEMLWVDKVENGYDTHVKKQNEMGEDIAPCMWIYAEGWKAFAYCCRELACTESPDITEGDYNIGLRWLNSGGTEFTDEVERTQMVRPPTVEEKSAKSITTMVNWNGPATECEKSICIPQKRKSHKRRHERK